MNMGTKIFYQFTLSSEQLDYLYDARYRKSRMEFLMHLVKSALMTSAPVRLTGNSRILSAGQFEKSELQLSKEWGCDRKTVAKVIARFNDLGIIRSEPGRRTTIHTVCCLAGWIIGNIRIGCPTFRQGYDYRNIQKGRLSDIPGIDRFLADPDAGCPTSSNIESFISN